MLASAQNLLPQVQSIDARRWTGHPSRIKYLRKWYYEPEGECCRIQLLKNAWITGWVPSLAVVSASSLANRGFNLGLDWMTIASWAARLGGRHIVDRYLMQQINLHTWTLERLNVKVLALRANDTRQRMQPDNNAWHVIGASGKKPDTMKQEKPFTFGRIWFGLAS